MNKPESELSAEQMVKQVWPDAHESIVGGIWRYGYENGVDIKLRIGKTWDEAASNLPPAATPEPAKIEICQCRHTKAEHDDGEDSDCSTCYCIKYFPEPPSEASVEGFDAWKNSKEYDEILYELEGQDDCLACVESMAKAAYQRGIADGRKQGNSLTFDQWWDESVRLAQLHLGSGDYWVSKGVAKKAWNAAKEKV